MNVGAGRVISTELAGCECSCDWEFHDGTPCRGPVADGTDMCWQCIVVCCAEAEEARSVSGDLEDIEMPAVEWEKRSTSEHRAHRDSRLVGLVTRPTRGVFWAHRISSSPATDRLEDHGPKTKHRTLAAAKAAIEQSAPPTSAAAIG